MTPELRSDAPGDRCLGQADPSAVAIRKHEGAANNDLTQQPDLAHLLRGADPPQATEVDDAPTQATARCDQTIGNTDL